MTNDFAPFKVFELARHNANVKAWLMAWEAGDVTWEQALIAIILYLAPGHEAWQNFQLDRALKALPRVVRPATASDSKTTE